MVNPMTTYEERCEDCIMLTPVEVMTDTIFDFI